MKKNQCRKHILLLAVGLMIMAAGFVLMILFQNVEGILRVLPYLCVGIGTCVFEYNLREFLNKLAFRKNPQAAKLIEIEVLDERNITIQNKAKAKAYDFMMMIFCAIMPILAIKWRELYILLIFLAAYIYVSFINLYYLKKYQKEM
jgi:hypothetical protein